MEKQITKLRVFRLVKHMGLLCVIHGDAHEGSTLIDMLELHALAEQFQEEKYYKKYLGISKTDNAKGKHYDFSEDEIIVVESLAFIVQKQKPTVN